MRFPAAAQLRPTPDRVRETLFNWLGQRLDGLACLDLFAGSGALGFEALSRGAARVVMVERDRKVVASAPRSRAQELGAAGVEIVHGDALACSRLPGERSTSCSSIRPTRASSLRAALAALAAQAEAGGARLRGGCRGPRGPAPWSRLREGAAGR